MKLLVKKKSVGYGVNTSDVAITDLANISTLKPGSFLIAFDNGVVITSAGSFTGSAGSKALIYFMTAGGDLVVSPPILVGRSSILKPVADHAAAAKVVTFDMTVTIGTTQTNTGVMLLDKSKGVYDPTRRDDITVYVDSTVSQATFNAALKAKIEKSALVASTSLTGNVLTITFVAGANVDVFGLGLLEQVKQTITTALAYGDFVSTANMRKFATECSVDDGNRDTSINGVLGTFTKDYGIEAYNYLIFGIELNTGNYSTGKPDIALYGATVYIAIPEGDLAATNEGFMDILKAATTGVSNDSGAAGVDVADN